MGYPAWLETVYGWADLVGTSGYGFDLLPDEVEAQLAAKGTALPGP